MNSIDNSMADAVVSIVNTDVYGKCKAYPVENIGASSFARWARETLNLLRAHPQLARTKRILLDSVAPEAMEALWGCVAELAAVEKDYPSAAVRNATTDAKLKEGMEFNEKWLKSVIAACSPNTNTLIVDEMRKIKFGAGATGGYTGQHWQAQDIMVYYTKLKALENESGDMMSTGLSDKTKLEIVSFALPLGLRQLIKATCPTFTQLCFNFRLDRTTLSCEKTQKCLEMMPNMVPNQPI